MIFDQNYLDYISRKQMEQQSQDLYQSNGYVGQNLTSQEMPMSQDGSRMNTSVQLAAAMYNQHALPTGILHQAATEKEKKLQHVQYECIKSELKEEYEKRVGFLHKRLNKKA